MIWIDAQLSPAIADWIKNELGVHAEAVRDLGLRDAEDEQIFVAARTAGTVVMTKDNDFVLLLERHGPLPKVILPTCGNTSNAKPRSILGTTLRSALELLDAGEELVEIG